MRQPLYAKTYDKEIPLVNLKKPSNAIPSKIPSAVLSANNGQEPGRTYSLRNATSSAISFGISSPGFIFCTFLTKLSILCAFAPWVTPHRSKSGWNCGLLESALRYFFYSVQYRNRVSRVSLWSLGRPAASFWIYMT